MNWKKTAKVGGVSLVTVAALGYGLLFTKPGNSAMAFYVESLLNTDPNVPIRVEEFTMTTNQLNLQLKVSDLIDTKLDGKFSLFSGNFDGDYTMSIDDLSRLNIKELKDMKARGSFATRGKIISVDEGYKLKGTSQLYGGDLNYDMLIDSTELQSLNFRFDELRLKNMLLQSGQIALADADIVINGKIKNAITGKFDGVINTQVKNGTLNTYAMKKLYGQDIPDDFTFSLNIDTVLDKTKAISKIDIQNSYSSLSSPKFTVDMQSEQINGDYNLEIFNIGNFVKTPNTNFKGKITTNGEVSGTLSNVIIKGVSALFGSDTKYTIAMDKDEVKSINMDMDGLSLKEFATQSGQKAMIDGKLNVKIDIKDAREGKLNGVITSNLSDVSFDKSVVKKQYDMDIANNLNLKAENHVKLQGDKAVINSKVITDIASLNVNDLIYNTKDETSKGTYVLKSTSMKELIGLSGMAAKLPEKLANDTNNAIEIKGNIQGGKNPVIDGKTDFLNGELNFEYAKNLLNVNLVNSGITLKKDNNVTFDANANANVKYNTKTDKVDLVFSFTQSDTKVDVKKAAFDINKNRVFADVDFTSLDKKMNYLIVGDMDNPDITLKAQKALISQKYVTFLRQEINKNLDDKKAKQELFRVINILSNPNATLTKKDMLGIEAGVQGMAESLKKEYSKFKNVTFTKEHLQNLYDLAEKMRKEKGILSDEDIKVVEEKSKAIIASVKSEWNSDYQKDKREEVLNYFNALGEKLKSGKLITKEEMDIQKQELSKVLDDYQSIISNKAMVDKELKKYDSIVKVVKLLKKDEKFDKKKFYKLIDDFNIMLDFIQYKIASSDETESQIEMINSMGEALKEKSTQMKNL
jgi:hypothetical protein